MKTLPPFILAQADAVRELCIRHGVLQLSLFGSAVSGNFDEANSDLDFLVEFTNPTGPGIALRFIGLAEDLEALFKRPVDLITKHSLRNPVFKAQLASTSQSLYAA